MRGTRVQLQPPMSSSPQPSASRRPGWLYAAFAGCAVILGVLVVAALVLADKPHFGWLVGRSFLPAMATAIIAGGLMLLVAALKLPARKTWHRVALVVWALIAITSPLFGFLFLLPFAVLAATMPVVAIALYAIAAR